MNTDAREDRAGYAWVDTGEMWVTPNLRIAPTDQRCYDDWFGW